MGSMAVDDLVVDSIKSVRTIFIHGSVLSAPDPDYFFEQACFVGFLVSDSGLIPPSYVISFGWMFGFSWFD